MKGPNIPHRWLAEKTAVFAIELTDAFVSDLKACTRSIQTIQKHVTPRSSAIPVPTLVIGGEKSPKELQNAVKDVAAALPNAHSRFLSGSGSQHF